MEIEPAHKGEAVFERAGRCPPSAHLGSICTVPTVFPALGGDRSSPHREGQRGKAHHARWDVGCEGSQVQAPETLWFIIIVQTHAAFSSGEDRSIF